MGDLSVWPVGSSGFAAPASAGEGAACGMAPMGICIAGAVMIMGVPPAGWRLMRTFSSPSVISISPMPDSWTRSISFFSFRRSMVASAGRGTERPDGGFEGELVSQGAEADDHARRQIGEIGVLPERLAGMHVGQVHLDEWDLHGRQRIAKRHAGVGKCRRIDDDERRFVAFR